MKTFKNILILLAALLFIFGAGFFFGRRNAEKNAPTPQVDTILIRDTIIDYEPQGTAIPAGCELVPIGTRQLLVNYSSIVDELRDSLDNKPTIVTIKDTTYSAVPLTKTTFSDDTTYKCEVLGSNTKMLWHESYQTTSYITKEVKVPTLPKLALSPSLSSLATPGIFYMGAGAKLDIWSGKWRFSPGVDYALAWGNGKWSSGPAVTFSINYNFILK